MLKVHKDYKELKKELFSATYKLWKQEQIIFELEENNKILKKQNIINQYKIDKAIDKLYCYGEVFDKEILKQFQKEMLNILRGNYENNKN